MNQKDLDLKAFHYELPEAKIAKYPLKDRSASKLLCYRKGQISHHTFQDIATQLPAGSHLVFNDTRVIPARLIFHKETGARIEVFLLEPVGPSTVHEEVMAATAQCQWRVMIGNAKKWKRGTALNLETEKLHLRAERTDEDRVTFSWADGLSFSEVLSLAGQIPLPPYLQREATEEDVPRYQTVYSRAEGAVAAPTAGLHFTPEVLHELEAKNISQDYLTLHVSAGTFQPIKVEKVDEHPMHREQVVIRKSTIEKLLKASQTIAVGTTSMRTLESLYWFGQLLEENPEASFFIPKLVAYTDHNTLPPQSSLENVLRFMTAHQLEVLVGQTEIFIVPGYQFRICKGLITNFHLPGSTLILLVAAFVGADWRTIYDQALASDYRFLSYGDSSFLLP